MTVTYTCPGCKRSVEATQLGNTMTWTVKHVNDNGDGETGCKYKGFVPSAGRLERGEKNVRTTRKDQSAP